MRTLKGGADARLTFEDPHGGGVVVDASGGLEGCDDDGRRGHQVVGEGVVQVALHGRGRLASRCVS